MQEEDNCTNKSITDFTNEDTLYMQKKVGGYMYTFKIKFLKFEKGLITGIVCDKIQPNNIRSLWIGKECFEVGSEIRGRISTCYTYRKGSGCRWFKKDINGKYNCN